MHTRTPFLLAILALLGCSSPAEVSVVTARASAQSIWSAVRALPGGGVRAAAVASTSSRIYVLAGNAGASTLTSLNRIYNPAADRWTQGAPLPGPRDFGMAATLPDGVHFLGGVGPSGLAPDHWRYDPTLNTWAVRAPLPILVDAAVARVVGGKLYVIGGGSTTGPTGAVQVYDPGLDTWTTGAPMPTARLSSASAVFGRRILIAGGQTAGVGTTDVLESYDTRLNQWSTLPPLPAGPREALGGGRLGSQFCVFGGRLAQGNPGGVPYPESYCFTPASQAWVRGPDMLTPRVEVGSIEFGNGLYAIGGRIATTFATSINEVLR